MPPLPGMDASRPSLLPELRAPYLSGGTAMNGYHKTLFPSLDAALREVQRFDVLGDYETRNAYVMMALLAAHWLDYPSGIRIDPKEPEWPCAFIELPTGQVSWHLPQHPVEWDGHSTEEKYDRCRRYHERPLTDPWGILGGAPLTPPEDGSKMGVEMEGDRHGKAL